MMAVPSVSVSMSASVASGFITPYEDASLTSGNSSKYSLFTSTLGEIKAAVFSELLVWLLPNETEPPAPPSSGRAASSAMSVTR